MVKERFYSFFVFSSCLAYYYFIGYGLLLKSLQANNSSSADLYMFPNIIVGIILIGSSVVLFSPPDKKR